MDKNTGDSEMICGHHRPFVVVRSDSGSEDVHYSVTYEGFPDRFKEVAETELNETSENKRRGFQHLKEYMTRESSIVLKDGMILAVLRACKYDVKKSEGKLKAFLDTHKDLVQRLTEAGMEKVERIIDDMPVGFLPYRDKHGRAIIYTRPYGFQLESYEMQDVAQVLTAMSYFFLLHPLTSVVGFVYYGECKSPSSNLLYSITNEMRRNLFKIATVPVRVARVEILNETYIIRCLAILFKSFLPKKFVGRVSLHGSSLRTLHEDYHPDILPEEFGGNMGPLSNAVYREKLLDFVRDLIESN